MKDVVRNDLFPSVEMVKSMSKEFGIAYFQEATDMSGRKGILKIL